MRGDEADALTYLQQINASNTQYWMWLSQLYLSLYESTDVSNTSLAEQVEKAPFHEQSMWRDEDFELLHRQSEMFFAAAIVKHFDNSTFNQQRLEKYLARRPAFPVNIINRQESIAIIMLLHQAGRLNEAMSLAHKLYEQLNDNYQTSPASFRFWNLGRYHLLAKLYCGDNCQTETIEPQSYLDKMFSAHHIWWVDDYQFIRQALKPWLNSELASVYLQKVRADLARVRG